MDIVEEIRQDREKGAKRLESEYKAGLMTLARRFCVDQSDAEELVNATFATVIENIDDYLEQSAFFAWMCQILTSLHSRNVRRKSGKEIVYPGVVPDAIDEKAQEEIYENLDHSLVREALAKLEPDDKELLVLRYFLDIPVAKMAKVLSIPAGTVKSRLHYARKALAAKLGIQAEKVCETVKKPGVKAVLLALALCALTAAAVTAAVRGGAQENGRRDSGRAASILGSGGVVPRAAAIGETGKTGRIRGYSLFAPVTAPVPPDSPVASTSAPVPPDSPVPPVITQSLSSKEQNMNTTLRSLAASAAFAAATAATTASGADWYVSPTGTGGGTSPSDRGDLMSVLFNGQVASYDTIHLAAGAYTLDVSKLPNSDYGAYLRVPDGIANLTLIGETGNPDDVRLVGNPSDKKRILYFPLAGNVVRDLTISGGYTEYQGAGICMDDQYAGNAEAAFAASNCVVENCSAAYQGANFGGLWRDCVIRNNEVRNKTPTPSSGATTSNVEGSGGGVFHATLYNCIVTNNVAGFCGGGIAGGRLTGYLTSREAYCTRNYVQLFDCTIEENAAPYDATGDGGGLGGGAYQCVVSNCVVSGNSATRPGGDGVTFAAYGHDYGNGVGGGVMDCEVVDSTIDGNSCYGGGGGAANSTLTRCHVTGNSTYWGAWPFGFGGGTYGCPLVKDCVLDNNRGGYGGAAFTGYLENCVITNNQATHYEGGATYSANTRNCIVVGNSAAMYYALCKGSHYGTLVYGNRNEKTDVLAASGIGADDGEAEAVAVNCTIWGNDNSSAQVSRTYMTNCIAGSVEYIPAAVNSFWRIGTVDNQANCISGEDKDPKFEGVTVADHPTVIVGFAPSAFAIKSGSPCRDRGLLLAGQRNETDIFGNPRVKYEGVDMGALECVDGVPFSIVIR